MLGPPAVALFLSPHIYTTSCIIERTSAFDLTDDEQLSRGNRSLRSRLCMLQPLPTVTALYAAVNA